MRVRPGLAAVCAAVLLAAAAPAAAGDPECDPEVERALAETAETGAREDFRAVRHAEMGIRDPASIFDLSCVSDMFDYAHSDILFDPGRAITDVLGLLREFFCDTARRTLQGYVGRGIDPLVFGRDLPRLPGLDVGIERGNVLDDARDAGRAGGNAVSPPPPRSPASPSRPPAADRPNSAAPASRSELFRSLIGGGE